MKIFLTGATGFLGAYIIRALLQEGNIHIIANYRASSRFDLVNDIKDKVDWREVDLDDLIAVTTILKEVDMVIHAAGFISFVKRDRAMLRKVNIDYTATLVNLSLECGVKRFIHISSVTTLGRAKSNGKMLDESSVWTQEKAYSMYGLSKYLGEREVWRGFAEGLNGVIVNPSMILGAGRWQEGMNKIFYEMDKGYRYYPSGGNAVVDVRDVAKMVLVLIKKENFNQRRIICSGTNVPLKVLAERIANALGKNEPKVSLSSLEGRMIKALIGFISRIAPNMVPISSEELSIADMPFSFDNSQSVKLLNFQYRPLELTIRETADAYQKGMSTF